ncbi:hypothetical protein SAMD00019534_036740 [Acytostelium subglobosum LB1]|uniref:hypothetical protein n=1 Tax=Acytostelium subglobosum LB1 TaxID=1410327 RepID=UPI000644B270|nr:hypothetical protein SAMD00019534_036740 [Acytostelium subglobosum LB1]GAM20499.1 hypothetical protein SAMD00019534_036740 [Acytostelium subglobosum LB1]|eukprot:XP_012760020.1 hypothetical protein SAMD00019534_036740 [Acytostelium subglobosum LB1]
MTTKVLFIIVISLLVICCLSPVANSYGEEDQSTPGHPLWNEREAHVLTNALRINPLQYAKVFYESVMGAPIGPNVLTPAKYPPVHPIYFEFDLMHASLAHDNDMITNLTCKVSHSDCNGTSMGDRLKKFISPTCNSFLGENMAMGMSGGLSANNLLICEKGAPPCLTDDLPFDKIGHRDNLMSLQYRAMGIGLMPGQAKSQYSYYWTMDFSSCRANIPTGFPVHGGSHTFINSSVVYITNYYDVYGSSNVTEALIHFSNGQTYQMSLEYNSAAKFGQLWTYRPATVTECLGYSFEFKTTNGTYIYPTTGQLQTLTKLSSPCKAWTSNTLPTSSTSAPSTTTSSTTDHPNSTMSILNSFSSSISLSLLLLSLVILSASM